MDFKTARGRPNFHGIDIERIKSSSEKLFGNIIPTPTIFVQSLSKLFELSLHLKQENLKLTSSFKFRGVFIALKALNNKSKKTGVITMSEGNHAQALVFRSQQEKIKSIIVMLKQTPFTKISKTKSYGAEIVLTGRPFDDAKSKVEQLLSKNRFILFTLLIN